MNEVKQIKQLDRCHI